MTSSPRSSPRRPSLSHALLPHFLSKKGVEHSSCSVTLHRVVNCLGGVRVHVCVLECVRVLRVVTAWPPGTALGPALRLRWDRARGKRSRCCSRTSPALGSAVSRGPSCRGRPCSGWGRAGRADGVLNLCWIWSRNWGRCERRLRARERRCHGLRPALSSWAPVPLGKLVRPPLSRAGATSPRDTHL